jgi:hypothetical protein
MTDVSSAVRRFVKVQFNSLGTWPVISNSISLDSRLETMIKLAGAVQPAAELRSSR